MTLLLMAVGILTVLASLALPLQQDIRSRQRNNAQERKEESGERREDSRRAQGPESRRTQGPGNRPGQGTGSRDTASTKVPQFNQIVIEDEDIPDSLLNPRWKIQRTTPITEDDLRRGSADLTMPDNLKQNVVYNDTLDRYIIGSKIGDSYINAPIMMTPEEYRKWSERQAFRDFFRSKSEEILKTQGKEKFSFTDMHFDLGPAEKIFGPGGVRIKTQGTAELKFGATMKNIDNPSLPVRNRKTTSMDFDEKININVNGKVGDKVNMNLNYNTDATFDFDSQNLKLKYEGKEDEIIKLVEAGNVSFPSNSSLVTGASSLFGIRSDWQFGKLKLQTVVSQKKSSSKSVSSKGGVQLKPFEIDAADYEENRHFFLSQFFRDKYAESMKTLPNVTTGIDISHVEIWVTNKTGNTNNTRNIIALTDLGENSRVSNSLWTTTGQDVPSNNANTEYSQMVSTYAAARNIDQTSTTFDGIGNFVGGTDYEKLESARLLSPSEYTVNRAMGYVSLKTALQTDQVLAVAYEYTYRGVTYQVGELANNISDVKQALFVKSLKNTSNNPQQGNWNLMMKNVYYLASTVEKDKFRLDVKFQSDTAGVYLSYIPEKEVKSEPIIRLLGADRLDNNNKAHSNGYFDYVEGYTVSNGRVFFPEAEPFGADLYRFLTSKGVAADVARKYCFNELYDSTKTIAKQIAEKDKFMLVGQFRGTSASVISLGAYNVPQGSVKVTANGVELHEGSDYTVDYSAGEVTIINQSILDAQPVINASFESNTDYGQQRKTMFGVNWEYDFSKNLQLSGTLQHLTEQSLTTKVNMGSEPLNNTLWGVNINWKKESQWLTNLLDRLPLLHCTQPSNITFRGEFAQLIAGQSRGTQDNASYLDDFENTKNSIDVSTPTSWVLSSVPSMFAEQRDKTTVASGYNRSQLAWYTIDQLFTRRSSSLTPSHIKSDLNQLSNHYVREIYVNEVFPNRQQSSYNGSTAPLMVLNMAYYPNERGPYNLNPDLTQDGKLTNPEEKWGGMMRRLDTNDFETANIEYIEFWMLDPFIYTAEQSDANLYGGDFYINLGEVSEDILRDGKKFHESGMPVDGTSSFTTTQWGKIPVQANENYAFVTTSGSRALQDVGFNGLTDEEERSYGAYKEFLTAIQGKVSPAVFDSIFNDPANDDYHYFRGSDYDQRELSILERYKRINNPQGNSPDNESRTESYDTSYKTGPDVEDINQDHTLNEYEKYYQYHLSIRPQDMVVGRNYIVDERTSGGTLRNGEKYSVRWYQFRIPIRDYETKVGTINDFSSIRFMRMFLTSFEKPIVLRFANFDLVRGEWRIYEQSLNTGSTETGKMSVSAVNIEENSDKTPVNYVLPPGISRVQDPTQPQLVESNEQALNIMVTNLAPGESKAVYKNTTQDLRQYKRLQMFAHANVIEPNATGLRDNQLAMFIRLGSDYKNNYYEYEIPLKLTPAGNYYDNVNDRRMVWPEENMLDVPLDIFTKLKKERNKAKAEGRASYNQLFTAYDDDKPANKVSIMGNPTLGEVKTMIIGVRNLSGEQKSGEVWVNELRLKEYNNNGGWAAQGALNMQLSDVGTLNVSGRMMTEGFGGLEQGVSQRSQNDEKSYNVTANFELGKFFPDKLKVSAPIYYSVQKEESRPKYNPLDNDMLLKDALESTGSKHERDSIESIAVTKTTNTNFSLSNVRMGVQTKGHPMPYDPANFSFSYSHSHRHSSGETLVYENDDTWRGAFNYSYTPVYKAFEPFKKIKSKSKYWDILKRFGINWLPQNIQFSTDLNRVYYEQQIRDMESMGGDQLPLTFNEQFLWNREFSLRWDFTKNLHMNFNSATRAQIEEPYTPVNKDLYPDRYTAWKDSVWTSIKNFGTPLDYQQNFTMSYQLPLNLIPIFDWLNADASYNATYRWNRGAELESGLRLGNTINNNRNLNINGTLNMEKLYNQIPFLKKTNERFNKNQRYDRNAEKRKKEQAKNLKKTGSKDGDKEQEKADKEKEAKQLPKNKRSYEKEITLAPDTSIEVSHGKKSRRLNVTAKTADGKSVKLKYKVVDDNKIKVSLPKSYVAEMKKQAELAAAQDNQKTDSLATQSASAAGKKNLRADKASGQHPIPNTLADKANSSAAKRLAALKNRMRKNGADSLQADSTLLLADSTLLQADSILLQTPNPRMLAGKASGQHPIPNTLADKAEKNPKNSKKKESSPLLQPVKLKLTVTAREPLDNKPLYKIAQSIARVAMMLRNVSISYRNQYSMSLAGFLPDVGKVFGQRSGDLLSPGLDFAFGLTDDSYIEKAARNNWLIMSDSITPASTNRTEDLQLRMTLEPVKNFKIDLNASRTETRAKSVKYMFQGNPTTLSGNFTMTTISLKSAFKSSGNANNGYHSSVFEQFCQSLEGFRQRVENQYANAVYPQGTAFAGKPFDPANGAVNRYSADVLVPAFLSAYTNMGDAGLSIFPALSRLLPNWTIRYSGLGQLPWLRDHFKSVNINHAYKSVYAVGAYTSFSTFVEYMGGLGFITEATSGNPIPNSMFNVSTVSVNESFSPLLGIDLTLYNNLTCKLEYRSTRVLTLSTTSVQLNETTSNDWVIGAGYKVNDVKIFGWGADKKRKAKSKKNRAGKDSDKDSANASSTTAKGKNNNGFNNDLNLRLDVSYRSQAAITRDIASMTSSASSGNSAFKLSFIADYTMSRLLTLSFYYDRQTNTPLLSSSSYPTTTQDFGLSLKFSLTR